MANMTSRTTWGPPGGGDGQLTEPQDVAVDEATGAIYVADTGNHRVVKFDQAGDFVGAWGWGVTSGNAEAQVCASGCQAGIAGAGPGQFDVPRYIEVDNSRGPSAHSVYVADPANGVVQKFSAAGALIPQWGDGGSIDMSENGEIAGLTVSSSGDVYLVGEGESYPWTQLSQDGTFRREFLSGSFGGLGQPNGGGIEVDDFGTFYETKPFEASGVYYRSPTAYLGALRDVYPERYTGLVSSGLALDRTTNEVFVAQRGYIDQFSLSPACTSENGLSSVANACAPKNTFGFDELVEASGLAFDGSTGRLYAADSGGDRLAVFGRVPLPTVSTEEPADITATSVTLNGHVEPAAGQDVESCLFEYGTDLTYDLGTAPCTPGGPLSTGTDVVATLEGLTPLHSYHFRLTGTGANGITRYGADMTFTATDGTPPAVTDTAASADGPSAATLEATIDSMGAVTVYRFEYGTSSAYGTQTRVSDPIGADDHDHQASRSDQRRCSPARPTISGPSRRVSTAPRRDPIGRSPRRTGR